ncbi:sulfotransferase family protein [Nonomuraea mesophila]|uniref:sulfotransferase family protein n=1 Tax=Nonomuraea mesophila TaxID=2530382 RepID=UPI001C6FFB1E|nr:sulfotransferase [Nonomuraea mesophila]
MRSDVNPVFLLAPARSCSTVAVAMLSQHPRIYGFPELLLFTAPTLGEVLHGGGARSRLPPWWIENQRSGLVRTVAQLHHGGQDDAATGQALAWLERHAHWPSTRLLDHLLDLVHPDVGLEKSPDTVADPQALQRCLEACPDAGYLHLTRHPLTTMRSMREHWGGMRAGHDQESLSARCAAAWYRSHTAIVTALARVPEERRLRVRAEDLLGRPATELPRILGWLGLEWTDAVLDRMRATQNWPFAGRGPSQNLYGGDWKFHRDPRLRALPDPGPVGFDESWGIGENSRRQLVRLAASLGYERT